MLKNSLQSDERLQNNPLGSHLRIFATSLMEDGYAGVTVRSKFGLLADFARWFGRTKLAITHIDERLVDSFVKHRKQVHRGDLKTLEQFLDHLRKQEVVPARKLLCDRSPLTDILNRYEKYLRSERGLVSITILHYQSFVRKFLVERFHEGPFLLREVKPSDISSFVLRHAHTMAIKRAQLMTTAFRSFFRYLFQKGELQINLSGSVPTVADWRLSTVPKYLAPDEVRRVLRSCNRRTTVGRRDYAILLLLARLGLRAGEVVALQLDDVNWRTGEIVVRGKGLYYDRMPLPPDVGKALAGYLRRDRPPCRTRRVFVCMKAPRRGFTNSSTLTTIVRRARGLTPFIQRCPLASSQPGNLHAPLWGNDGGNRRSSPASDPQLYGNLCKVDFDSLRSLAHPWPIGGGQ